MSSGPSYYRTYGRIELCMPDRTWRVICSEGFDNVDAGVACHHLGYSQYGKNCMVLIAHMQSYKDGQCTGDSLSIINKQ